MSASREFIIGEIQRLAAANQGQAPGYKAFRSATSVQEHEWRGLHWARWGDALAEAGFAPNEWQARLDPDAILESFAVTCRRLAHIPTTAEMDMRRRTEPDVPSTKTLRAHFGGQAEALDRLRQWVAERPAFADVAAILGSARPRAITAAPRRAAAPSDGFVYLIRSGPHHKIGRGSELERRVKQIRVALPDAAVLEHSIRTDDPAGIEAYWHRRFADRRANGEWFKLTPADVAAVKRRTFQ